MKRVLKLVTLAVVALGTFASGAGAAQTITPSCSATMFGSDIIFNASHAAAADGVITSWGTTLAPGISPPGGGLLRLKIVRSSGASTYLVVGESQNEVLAAGTNTFASHIPIKAGDYIGSWSATGSPYCNGADSDFFYKNDGAEDVPVGGSYPANNAPGNVDSISATIEPDADRDGYGDESQDSCPWNPASQSITSACPAGTMSSRSMLSTSAFTVYISSAFGSPVGLTGSVKAGKKTYKLAAKNATLVPFTINTLKLKFPSALKRAIAAAPKSKQLKLKAQLSGGAPLAAVKKFSVKLSAS